MKVYIHILILVFCSFFSYTQDQVELRYVSPKPGSRFIMPENNIAIRHGEKLDVGSIDNSVFNVYSSNGNRINGDIILSDDGRTLIFKPIEPYQTGDNISVRIKPGLKTNSGKKINPIEFSFEITHQKIDVTQLDIFHELIGQTGNDAIVNTEHKFSMEKYNNLPEDFPNIEILVQTTNDDEYYFFCPNDDWNIYPEISPYLVISDATGVPVYYRRMESSSHDLKIQPNGFLSFSAFQPYWGHILMDSSFNFIDKFTMGNGYTYTDFHEFKILDNGHVFVMTFDAQLYAMDTVVPGGDPNATVVGWVFQELDINKNVVFQWRSWDHYQITDADEYVDLTASNIDYTHGNAIEVYSENSLILSPRNLNEITKIDWNTGEIIWRLGGENNMFEFVNDDLGFSRQHDCRKNADGNITLFDNGTYHPDPKFSSVVEYELDEDNYTATLIRRLQNDPNVFGMVMGNGFETPDKDMIAGWGSGVPNITQFNTSGNIDFMMKFNALNYRAYRNPWKTTYFYAQFDSLSFNEITYSDSIFTTFQIFNPQIHEIEISSDHLRTDFFKIQNTFPISITAGGSTEISVMFKPDTIGEFRDILTLNSDINNDTLLQRIAIQIKLIGHATQGQAVGDLQIDQIFLYPNPSRDIINIRVPQSNEAEMASLFNTNGQLVDRQKLQIGNNIISISDLPAGVYQVKLKIKGSSNFIYKRFIKH